MVKRESLMIKRVTSGNLTLTPVEESYLIKDICVQGPADPTNYFKVSIRGTTMNYIPAYLIPFVPIGSNAKTFFHYIKEKYPNFPLYRVENGADFVIQPESTYSLLEVRYEVYDPGDISPNEPGGRLAPTRIFLATGYISSEVSATGWHKIDAVIGVPDAPDYPFTDLVPADRQLEIYGMAVFTRVRGSTKPVYLRIWDQTKVLFDKDKNGFFIDPTTGNELDPYISLTGSGGTYNAVGFMRFDEPWVLKPQTKLTFEVYVEYDGSNALQPKDVCVTLIGLEKRV